MLLNTIYTNFKETAQNSQVVTTLVAYGAISVPVIVLGRAFSLMSPATGAFYALVQLGALRTVPNLFDTSGKVNGLWSAFLTILKKNVIPSCIAYGIVAMFTTISLTSLTMVSITSVAAIGLLTVVLKKSKAQKMSQFLRTFVSTTKEKTGMNGEKYNGLGSFYGYRLADALVLYEKNKNVNESIKNEQLQITVKDVFTDALKTDGNFMKFVDFYAYDDDTDMNNLSKIKSELFPMITDILENEKK